MICAAVSVLFFSCAAAGKTEPAVFVPDTKTAGELTLENETWIERGAGYEVRLRRLTDSERQAYFEEVVGSTTDPFASRPDQPRRFTTFMLELRNRSAGSMTFQTQTCWLTTNVKEIFSPLGLEGLSRDFGMLEEAMPPAYEQVRPALIEGSHVIPSGDSLNGLLVFRPFEPKTKRFRVDVQFVMSGGELIRITAPYKREKKK